VIWTGLELCEEGKEMGHEVFLVDLARRSHSAVACALEGTVLSGAVPRSLAGDLRFRGYGWRWGGGHQCWSELACSKALCQMFWQDVVKGSRLRALGLLGTWLLDGVVAAE